MADWDDLRRSLEDQPVRQPPLSALRERRRRRQQRKAIAATCAVVMVGSAAGLAVLGETGRRPGAPGGAPVAAPTALSQIVNSDRLVPPKDYEDYVVTDVDFVSKTTGWAIGMRCVRDACDVATWRTGDGGETWGEAVPVATRVPRSSYQEEDARGGGVRSIRMVDGLNGYAFNPDLYVTRDGARTWQRQPRPSKVTSVSAQGRSVWVTERGCAKDLDCDLAVRHGTVGGADLAELDVPETNGALAIVRRENEREAYLVAWDAPDGSPAVLHRTRDGGRTWTRGAMPCPDADAVSLSARPGVPAWLVCSSGDTRTAYTSFDTGATWGRQPNPPAGGVVTDVLGIDGDNAVLTTQTPGQVLVYDRDRWHVGDVAKAYGYGNLDYAGGDLFAMGDAGDLWGSSSSPEAKDAWYRLKLPPGSPKSTESPATRGLRDASTSWMGLSFLDGRRGWAVGENCGDSGCRPVVRRTSDGGDTWSQPVFPPPPVHDADVAKVTVWSVAFADERHGWIAGRGFYETRDGGATWRELKVPRVARVLPRGGVVWVLAYEGCDAAPCVPAVYRGPVGGELRKLPSPGADETGRFTAYDERTAYFAGYQRGATTTDGGATWTRTKGTGCLAGSVSAWAAGSLWAICAGGSPDVRQRQAVSTDGGVTWVLTDLPGEGMETGQIVALSATYAWRTGAKRGVLVTRDGGKTWTGAANVGDPAGALTFADATHGWLVAGNVLYRTTDGEQWERLG